MAIKKLIKKHYWIEASIAIFITSVFLLIAWNVTEYWGKEILRSKKDETCVTTKIVSDKNVSQYKTVSSASVFFIDWNASKVSTNPNVYQGWYDVRD